MFLSLELKAAQAKLMEQAEKARKAAEERCRALAEPWQSLGRALAEPWPSDGHPWPAQEKERLATDLKSLGRRS